MTRQRTFLVLAAALAATAAAALEVPFLTGRVNDYAGLMGPDAEARLEAALAALEEETGAQVAVLTIPSLEGEALEDFSLRVAETWALGRKGVDDGVLLLIARDDRKMRIEVGYGLEPSLTDAQSGRILNNIVRPRFRAGDFEGGIEAGAEAITAAVRGQEVIVPDEPERGAQGPLAIRLGMLVVFLLFMSLFASAALFQKGCGGWFLYLFLVPFYFAFPTALVHPWAGVGLMVLWLVMAAFLRLWLHRTAAGKKWLAAHPTVKRWGSSSGGFRGGSFSSGGFSGGGGSFGGGGASSSW